MSYSFSFLEEKTKFKIIAAILLIAVMLLILFTDLDKSVNHWPM